METGDTRYRGLVIVLGLLLLIVLIVPVMGWTMMGAAGWGMMGPGMMGGYTGSTATASGWTAGAAMLLGWLTMVAFWGALIVGMVLLVRWLGIGTAARGLVGAPSEEPLAILRRRYAAGEITDAQFDHMRHTLEG